MEQTSVSRVSIEGNIENLPLVIRSFITTDWTCLLGGLLVSLVGSPAGNHNPDGLMGMACTLTAVDHQRAKTKG